MRKGLNSSPSDRESASSVSDEKATPFQDLIANTLDFSVLLTFYNDSTRPFFDNEWTLRLLKDRYDLPASKDFEELLNNYERLYGRVSLRSSKQKILIPREILLQAIRYGIRQLVQNGLKLRPEMRELEFYVELASAAAEGMASAAAEGMASAAAESDYLEIIKFLMKGLPTKSSAATAWCSRPMTPEDFLLTVIFKAAERKDSTALKLLMSLSEELYEKETSYWDQVLAAAVASNHVEILRSLKGKPYNRNPSFLADLLMETLRDGRYELWLELLPLTDHNFERDEMLCAAVDSEDAEVIKHFLPAENVEAYVDALYQALALGSREAFSTIVGYINSQHTSARSIYVSLGVEIAQGDDPSDLIWVIEAIKKGPDAKELLWKLREGLREQGIQDVDLQLIIKEAWDNLVKGR